MFFEVNRKIPMGVGLPAIVVTAAAATITATAAITTTAASAVSAAAAATSVAAAATASAVTAAATATTTAVAATVTTRRAFFPGAGLVYGHFASAVIGAVKGVDSCLAFAVIGHFNEAEAF